MVAEIDDQTIVSEALDRGGPVAGATQLAGDDQRRDAPPATIGSRRTTGVFFATL